MSSPDPSAELVAAVKAYAAVRTENREELHLSKESEGLTPTEVAVCVSDLLDATDIEVFELIAWQTWGRA